MARSPLIEGPITLDKSIYPEECLAAAGEAYRPFLSVHVIQGDSSTQTIELAIGPEHSLKAEHIRKEFLNYLLDLAFQTRTRAP